MHEASFYKKLDESVIMCELCPRKCIIEPGRLGNCHARKNRNGELSSEVYGRISSMNLDAIEKKPLYHFYPGKKILSIGTTGCNLHCSFCQNHILSQCNYKKTVQIKNISSEELIQKAKEYTSNIGIAYTYNEPIINYEYVIDTARLAKMADLKTVLVSNGYINPDPLHMLLGYIDAFNIDLKAFNENFYKKNTKATLKPVKESIKQIAKSGKHLEITNLIIPNYNSNEDEFENMCKWIVDNTDNDIVLHLSRYFPRHELNQYPTSPEILFNLYDIAKYYLKFVYIGNMATEIHSNSFCPKCQNTLIERTYYNIVSKGIDEMGNCNKCGTKVFKYI